jgi:hypothetical protein
MPKPINIMNPAVNLLNPSNWVKAASYDYETHGAGLVLYNDTAAVIPVTFTPFSAGSAVTMNIGAESILKGWIKGVTGSCEGIWVGIIEDTEAVE